MDDYPAELAPYEPAPFEKEAFSHWWSRVGNSFPSVPPNVARQWIWRHWGQSTFGWLPSAGAEFSLVSWSPADIAALCVGTRDDYVAWGEKLLREHASGPLRYWVAAVMARRRMWPVPPIVLNYNGVMPLGGMTDCPLSTYVLLEGNRRTAIAKALAARGTLHSGLPVWVLTYRGMNST